MKILLACLMCLVLGAAECFAIDGGPVYGGGQLTVTGNYAGVLLPTLVAPTQNTLVLFTIRLPRVGLGNGEVAMFTNGVFYPGTFQGTADPDTAKLYGVVNASFTRTVDTVTFTSLASGGMNGAKLRANANPTSAASVRITGDASLTYTSDDPIVTPQVMNGLVVPYTIIGFKQSEATS